MVDKSDNNQSLGKYTIGWIGAGRMGYAMARRLLLAGADVAMVTSAVYRDGPDAIRTLTDGLREFMNQHQLTSMRELQMQRPLEFATNEDRATYMAALAARLDASQTHDGGHVGHGDRFGHSATLRD